MSSYHREVILSKWEIVRIMVALAVYARELDINSEKYQDIMKLSDELDRELEMFLKLPPRPQQVA